jgi:hypothetical protein
MPKTRAGRYGKNIGVWIDYTINTLPEKQRRAYAKKFIEELKTYSTTPRKKGEPMNDGCVHELSDLSCVDVTNPEDLAKLVKENLHMMYQKRTSAKVLLEVINYLESSA